MEASKLMDRASHNVTLPFTRYLAGHGEYTPVHFGERRSNTTWAHQLASAAILWAPVQTYAANPDNLLASPAVELIKSLPTVWDETIVLPPSEIGEIAVYAQRKGSTWFLSVMNGVQPIKVKIPLTFLLEKNYTTLVAHDIPGDPADIKMEVTSFNPTDSIELKLEEGGGFMARFVPAK
jgi:alpha-glucosidase